MVKDDLVFFACRRMEPKVRMVRAVQPSRTVWFWALIAGVVSLLSSAALLWNSQRVQRLHFTQAQGASLAALTQQLNAYDALLAQVAQSETPPPPTGRYSRSGGNPCGRWAELAGGGC